MIVVSGTVQVKAELRDEAVQIALKMAKASEAEAGCVTYRFYADLEDPTIFRIFEQWEDEAALHAHFETEHMAEFRQQLPRILASRNDIYRFDVSSYAKI